MTGTPAPADMDLDAALTALVDAAREVVAARATWLTGTRLTDGEALAAWIRVDRAYHALAAALAAFDEDEVAP